MTAAEQAIEYGHSANKVGRTEEALQHFQKAHQMQVSMISQTLWHHCAASMGRTAASIVATYRLPRVPPQKPTSASR